MTRSYLFLGLETFWRAGDKAHQSSGFFSNNLYLNLATESRITSYIVWILRTTF
jgi:hypothetical protein